MLSRHVHTFTAHYDYDKVISATNQTINLLDQTVDPPVITFTGRTDNLI